VFSRAPISLFSKSLGGHQDDIGALNLKIRQRIFGGAPAQFGSLGSSAVNRKWARSGHFGTPTPESHKRAVRATNNTSAYL
jgi:hypothetical protein